MSARLASPNQRLYLGHLGERPIGLIRAALSEGEIYLNSFGVLPELQGKGYGRQILRAMIQVIQELSEESISVWIEVETENDNALHLYQSCGFETVATFHYFEVTF